MWFIVHLKNQHAVPDTSLSKSPGFHNYGADNSVHCYVDVEVEETVVYQATVEAKETVTIEQVRGTSQHIHRADQRYMKLTSGLTQE
jgi:hypothetical protein